MANTDKFTGKAAVYARFRPDYPDALISDLISENRLNPTSVVADIGAGTGILTGQLLKRGLHVAAVEPNADMRRIAVAQFGSNPLFSSVPAPAEQTTLKAESIHLVTVAQAFHWFDAAAFKEECRRILIPGGKVVLIWNSRVPNAPLIKETEAICQHFCPDFHGFSGGMDETAQPFHTFFEHGKYTVKKYDHPLSYSLEDFIGRHLSASYAPKTLDENYQPYISALTHIFRQYNINSRVCFPNVTRSYSGTV